ncbi:calcium-binding protein [Amphibalanus amphitrite]|uniref:Calcium-binding protein n=1 Tax=Amphibalanus amphitrite TaxID=1232801 RepID=A0A6A4VWP7_AMPAM|nr:calcium-binding protein [Amphibalanus amphitrite]KAF0300418.1 calcium-binding protein [Amphibalanus amphitrite]
MKTCINMPIRSSRNKIILTLYLVFAVYLIYVIIFLASMLFRSASDVKTKIRALPKYMSDAEIDKIRVLEVGTLQQQLQQAFGKADDNKNGYLDKDELSEWIQIKVSEHITVGVKTNFKVFLLLDKSPKDGWISMEEYDALFLSSRGAKTEEDLSRSDREQLMSERAEFLELGNEEKLTIDELLTFRHPESSHAHLLARVTELIDTLDEDGDGALSVSELGQLSDPAYRPSEEEAANFPVSSETEMRALHARLDTNGDQKLDQHELLVFADPRHVEHASRDAARLIRLADADGDGQLALTELQMHPDQFRMIVDARHRFHQPGDRR